MNSSASPQTTRRAPARLAWCLLGRQWQAGELRLVLAATLLAALLSTLIAAVGDRLEKAFVLRAAEMLGADLVLSGSQAPATDTLARAQRHGVSASRALDFNTMVAAPGAGEDDPVLLTAARAVEGNYPLRGALQVLQDGVPVTVAEPPQRGEVWVEKRVAEELGLGIGDRIEVGLLPLTISAIAALEPDRGGGFSSLSPRILFSRDDVDATGVVQPGSRVRYRTLFSGETAALDALFAELDANLAPNEELLDARGGSGKRGTAQWLGNTLQFFALAGVLGIVLCGAAIAIAADRHARRLYDTVALLRTFGMAQAQIQRVLMLEIVVLALVAGVVGAALGYGLQALLVQLAGEVLPVQLPPAGARAAGTGLLTAAIALPAFAWPALVKLRDVSPVHVLRRDLDVMPQAAAKRGSEFFFRGKMTPTPFSPFIPGLLLLAGLVVFTAPEPLAAALTLLALGALLLVTLPLATLLARRLKKSRAQLPLPWRLATDRLAHTPWRFAAQLVAFALILTTMTLAALLRGDLLADWQRQLPADTPNIFAMNLLPHEADAFRAAQQRLGIAQEKLYPVTPGRLLRVNERTLEEILDDAPDARGPLDRDLILTEAEPGTGYFDAAWTGAQVSVEQDLAEQLGVKTGDTLTFLIAGNELALRVSGTREVDWNSFQPNFFMVLSPGALASAPTTLLTSFHTEEVTKSVRLLRAEFPAITLLEVGPLLARVQTFADALATGVQSVLALLLVAALVLMVATVVATLDERLAQAAVLRTLGARRSLLRRTLLAEFALLGLLAGLLAVVTTEIARALLLVNVLEMAWAPLPWAWLLVPPGSAALLALAGWLAARRSLDADAAVVLRESV
jgi:putative ABC transport system permease protein